MSKRAYCDQTHPAGDAEADRWCEMYHRPATPRPPREVVSVGWDGLSQPMLRYRDELHLPDYRRSIVAAADRR